MSTAKAAHRLLYIGNFTSHHSGSSPSCEELSGHLESTGFEVSRASRQRGRVLKLLDMAVFSILRGPSAGVALIDVFSTAAFVWAEVCAFLLRRIGTPVVLVLRGGDLVGRARRSPKRVRQLFSAAELVVTPSRFLQRDLQAYSSSQIQYVPNGLVLARYGFRRRVNPEPRLVWLRAFHCIYQPEMAVKVLMSVRKKWPGASLLMAGPDRGDGTLDEVRYLIQEEGLSGAVDIVGNVSKMRVPDFLDRGDIFLNTTTAESFGVGVMEAAACGLCIVSTNVGELPLLWEDDQDVLLVDPDDPGGMTKHVLRILADRSLAEKLSVNARGKAEEYDYSKVLPLWGEFLQKIVKDRDG